MDQLLENIFKTGKFTNNKSQVIEIHSETSREQCEYLQNIIFENHFRKSIEIGFAYGISTLAIMESIFKNDGSHCVIDKFQHSDWGGNGIDLMRKSEYFEKLEFIEDFSYNVLPNMLANDRTFEFAYIDSTKQFDWLLVDFFYLDKILTVNGIIVFDDVGFPGIRKLLRYISQYPNYKIYSQFPKNQPPSALRRLAGKLREIPKFEKVIKEELLLSDWELGINSSCVALRKIDVDKRDWVWHVNF